MTQDQLSQVAEILKDNMLSMTQQMKQMNESILNIIKPPEPTPLDEK